MAILSSQRPRLGPNAHARRFQRLPNVRAALRGPDSRLNTTASARIPVNTSTFMPASMQLNPQNMTEPHQENINGRDEQGTDLPVTEMSHLESEFTELRGHIKGEMDQMSSKLDSILSDVSQLMAEVKSTRQEVDEYFQHHKTETESFITLVREAAELDKMQYALSEVQPEQEDFMAPAPSEQDRLPRLSVFFGYVLSPRACRLNL